MTNINLLTAYFFASTALTLKFVITFIFAYNGKMLGNDKAVQDAIRRFKETMSNTAFALNPAASSLISAFAFVLVAITYGLVWPVVATKSIAKLFKRKP